MSEDSYFIFNLIDNCEVNMSNCDKMLDIEKVKMFDKIADIFKNETEKDLKYINSSLSILDSHLRCLCRYTLSLQWSISNIRNDSIDNGVNDFLKINSEILYLIRDFICKINDTCSDFSKMEDQIEKKIESLK
ncbi:MAG: hypothetical protein ACRCSZ_10990 [Lactococcus lactis]